MMNSGRSNVLIAFIITIFPILLLFSPIIINYDKTGSNTFVINKDYSHLSRNQVYSRLDQDFSLPQELTLSANSQNFILNTSSFSAQIDKTKTASNLLYRRLNDGVFTYIKYFFRRKDFSLTISYDQSALDGQIESITNQINKPFVPTEIELKNNNLIIHQGTLGLEADNSSLKENIISNLSNHKLTEPISINTKSVGVLPDNLAIDQTKARAQKIIGKSLTLKTENNSVDIDDKTLISWLGFQNDFQKNKIEDYSNNLSQSLKSDPVNAVFKFENGKVLDFEPSRNGLIPQTDQLVDLIINNLPKIIDSNDKLFSLNIPVVTVEPVVKTDDVNNLGIKDLLGTGTSTFKHSAATRNQNISKGASIVNRILVPPGETFSFIKNLGEVSLEAGYKKAYIIREGRTELDVGGGICQVSTTLFRAMLNAGLDITERKAHAYRVSYYEEDSKPGFDATVFIPNPDLKFVNDTGHYVLIQNTLDMENRRLTYEIYGTSDGRKSTIANYRQWGAQPAPPDVWIDDPTLPAGKTVQDEHSVPGLKTSFDWTVTDKDGNIVHQKTFTSNFVPWAAVYRRGTGQ